MVFIAILLKAAFTKREVGGSEEKWRRPRRLKQQRLTVQPRHLRSKRNIQEFFSI